MRRLGAFWIDIFFIMAALTPIVALPTLVAESFYTGTFEWQFERASSRGSDVLIILTSTLVMFVAIYIYFYICPTKNKQTVGQYLLNYKIIDSSSEFESADYSGRVLYAAIGVCAWPFALYFASKDRDGDFWWDNKSNTKAVRVVSVGRAEA